MKTCTSLFFLFSRFRNYKKTLLLKETQSQHKSLNKAIESYTKIQMNKKKGEAFGVNIYLLFR